MSRYRQPLLRAVTKAQRLTEALRSCLTDYPLRLFLSAGVSHIALTASLRGRTDV